ncbi:MAG TPA: PilZ domain-containing protein [Phycisphaerae bacterium]|nr:PilZ domain-containing protein [Phycisphaerae bacterium]
MTSSQQHERLARAREKRRSERRSLASSAVVLDDRNHVLASGRIANVSEHGAFVVAEHRPDLAEGRQVILEITVPLPSPDKRESSPTVRYECRIVRIRTLGQLMGIGLELLAKL